MNVGELLKELSFYDADMEIIVASDEEGNSFHPLSTVQDEWGRHDGYGYTYEIYADEDVAEFEEGELEKVLCIWP